MYTDQTLFSQLRPSFRYRVRHWTSRVGTNEIHNFIYYNIIFPSYDPIGQSPRLIYTSAVYIRLMHAIM